MLYHYAQNKALEARKNVGRVSQVENFKRLCCKMGLFLSHLENTEMPPCAAFIQHITHEVFKKMIQVEYPLPAPTNKALPLLTDIEVNALRYVAGYVCRTLHDRLKSSNVEGKRLW